MEDLSTNHHKAARLYPELSFGGFSRRDGTFAFFGRVNSLLRSDFTVLDYGCGLGRHIEHSPPFLAQLQTFRGRVARVIGADVSAASAANPYIDKFCLSTERHEIKLPDGSVDLCVCNWGIEHFTEPRMFFEMARRVVRPGGLLCIRTPNRWHYSSLGASLIPFRYHQKVRSILGHFHGDEDVFPVAYRANTKSALSRALESSNFDFTILRFRGESHTALTSYPVALAGEVLELSLPSILVHELHAFGRLRA